MAGNTSFDLVQDYGWRTGLNNLLRAEFGRWWKTRTWWTQSLIWIGVIDFILFMVISEGRAEGVEMPADELLLLYGIFGGMFVIIGVIIRMQSAIVGEKVSGTAAWVLSKPVSRIAFVISKLVANALGIGVTAILIPGVITYFLITNLAQIDIPAINFVYGIAILFLSSMFWLVLTLMMGAFFKSRGPVIGIPLALIMGQQFITGFFPWITYFIPYQLVIPSGEQDNSVVGTVLSGATPDSWVPVYMAVILIFLLTAISIWRFSREEF